MKTINETPVLQRLGTSVLAALSANKAAVGALALLLGAGLTARADDNRAPEVPEDIAVDDGFKVQFHGFGVGVQIYTWNGTDWGTAAPRATLFDDDGNVVALHFRSGSEICPSCPAWQSNSGSKVVAALPPSGKIEVDRTAILWLRLAALTTEGAGIFADTKFIQRVNTVGGLAPAEDGTFVGQVAEVPYAADYFFYRAE